MRHVRFREVAHGFQKCLRLPLSYEKIILPWCQLRGICGEYIIAKHMIPIVRLLRLPHGLRGEVLDAPDGQSLPVGAVVVPVYGASLDCQDLWSFRIPTNRGRRLQQSFGLTQWQSSEVLGCAVFEASSRRRVTPRALGSYDYAYSLSLRFPAHR